MAEAAGKLIKLEGKIDGAESIGNGIYNNAETWKTNYLSQGQ